MSDPFIDTASEEAGDIKTESPFKANGSHAPTPAPALALDLRDAEMVMVALNNLSFTGGVGHADQLMEAIGRVKALQGRLIALFPELDAVRVGKQA